MATAIYPKALSSWACTKCKADKDVCAENFEVRPKNTSGFSKICRLCLRAARRVYAHSLRADNPGFDTEYRRTWLLTEPAERRILRNVKCRAKKFDIPFDLVPEDIHVPSHCPVLGFELDARPNKEGRGPRYNSPSIDRINPSLGYVKGNVQIISNKANTMKNNATPAQLRMFARWLTETLGDA